jgi:tetratricopeptide (TPR) repeat protein
VKRRAPSTLALAVALAGAPAWAGEPDAREASRAAFRRGVSAAQAQDYARARDAFVEAHRLFPHPSILLNLGVVRVRLGEHLLAERDLLQFLADDGGAPPEELQSARAALAEARRHLGTIRVRVATPGARAALDGAPVPLAPAQYTDVRSVEGEHVLEVSAPGHVARRLEFHLDGGATVTEDVALDEAAPSPASRGVPARAVIGASLVGAGSLAVLVGAGFGVAAIGRANAYNTMGSPGFQEPATKSEGIAFRTTADVAIVLGAAAAASGLVVLFWPAPKANAKASVGVGLGALWLSGAFD